MKILDAYRYYNEDGAFVEEIDGQYGEYDTVEEARKAAVDHITGLLDVVSVDGTDVSYNDDGVEKLVSVILYDENSAEL